MYVGDNMHSPGRAKINSGRAKVTVTHGHTSHDKPVRKKPLLPYLPDFLSNHSILYLFKYSIKLKMSGSLVITVIALNTFEDHKLM